MLDKNSIRELLEKAPEKVLSLYLNVNPGESTNQNQPPGWRIYAKNALGQVEKSLSESAKQDWSRIRSGAESFLQEYSPAGRSLALFVGTENWIESYSLPVELQNHYSYGELDIVQLLWAVDECENYLVVLVDSEQARLYSAYLGHAIDGEAMFIDFGEYDFREHAFIHARSTAYNSGEMRQGGGPDDFEDLKRDHVRRFHKEVANRIARVLKDDFKARRILLGGNERAAHQVKEMLHESLKPMVSAILSVPVETAPDKISEAIEKVLYDVERSHEIALVDEVIDLSKSGARGAIGLEAVKQACEMQQVELLILPFPPDDERSAADLTLEAFRSGADIELVHGDAADRLRQEKDGIAARLFYAIK